MRDVFTMLGRVRFWRINAALMIAAAVATGCGGSNSVNPLNVFLTGIFFPLNSGDTRTFRQINAAGATVSLTQTIDAPATINGFTVLPMTTRNAAGAVARVEYYLADSSNGVSWVGSDEGTSTLRLNPPLVTPLNLAPGQTVSETVSVTGTGAFANVKTLTSTFQFIRLESVTVFAGTFATSAQVQIDTTFRDAAGVAVEQRSATAFLAPHVGLIKVLSSLGTTNDLASATIAGAPVS